MGPLVSNILLNVEVLVVDWDSVELAFEVKVIDVVWSHEHASHVEVKSDTLGWDGWVREHQGGVHHEVHHSIFLLESWGGGAVEEGIHVPAVESGQFVFNDGGVDSGNECSGECNGGCMRCETEKTAQRSE